MTTTDISIPVEEWAEVVDRVSPFVDGDESRAEGNISLRADGHRRRWTATDGPRLVVLEGGPGPERANVGLSYRVARAAVALASGPGDDVVLRVPGDGDGWSKGSLMVIGARGSVAVPAGPGPFPEGTGPFSSSEEAGIALARPEGEALVALLDAARDAPAGTDLSGDSPLPLFWVEVDDQGLSFAVTWGPGGEARYTLACRTEGAARVAVNPAHLGHLVSCLGGDGCSVALPLVGHGALRISAGSWTGHLLALDTGAERLRPGVEGLIRELTGHDEVPRDADGDYVFSWGDTCLYARLEGEEPARLRVFSVVLDAVEATSELLAELNEVNAHLGFARAFVEEGQVLLTADLVAETLDRGQLVAACRIVGGFADELGSTLAAVFGGRPWRLDGGSGHHAGTAAAGSLSPVPRDHHTGGERQQEGKS